MIEPDFTEFVDDDQRAGQRGVLQQRVEKAGLAGAEKAGDDVERQRVRQAHGPTGMSLPKNTGALVGAPVGDPPGCSTVTA